MIRIITPLFAFGAVCIAQPLTAQDTGDLPAGEEDSQNDRQGNRTSIDPYIEVSQVFTQQFEPTDNFVTYTQLAAGVDASLIGRNSGATAALRYERNFAWDNSARDRDTISGLVRAYTTFIPRKLKLDAGAVASRTRVDGAGGSLITPIVGDDDNTVQTYSAYAGPTLSTYVNDIKLDANYRIGYTRVDGPDAVTLGGDRVELFDESLSHSAMARAATSPGDPLPVGLGLGAGFYQEDMDSLDQRVRDAYVRADVTVPISPTLALVGGIGAEDVEVSSRDALRDLEGNPIIGPDGRYITDSSSPRVASFESDGVIWDVGVMWRPSSRTTLEATYGRRYDSGSVTGRFTWTPDARSNFSLSAYDAIQGFGGRLTNSISSLPVDFDVIRDPLTGNIIGCTSAADGSDCLSGLIGSIRSSVFRGRGVAANYSREFGRTKFGAGVGYDNRKFIGANNTVLAIADGVTDETWYGFAGAEMPMWRGYLGLNGYASWFDSGFSDIGDSFAMGSTASYIQRIYGNLSGRAAVSYYTVDRELTNTDLSGISVLIGLRYEF